MTQAQPINRYRSQFKKRRAISGRQLAENRVELTSPGRRTVVELERDTLRWAETRWVPDDLLSRLEAERNLERRAPLGDRHGAWQKVGEIPLSMIWAKLPQYGGLDDEEAFNTACKAVLNDSDYRKFRADGNHRKL